jgi:hypothetical protein
MHSFSHNLEIASGNVFTATLFCYAQLIHKVCHHFSVTSCIHVHIVTCYLLTRRIIYVGCGFRISIYWILHQAMFTITYIVTSHEPTTSSGSSSVPS